MFGQNRPSLIGLFEESSSNFENGMNNSHRNISLVVLLGSFVFGFMFIQQGFVSDISDMALGNLGAARQHIIDSRNKTDGQSVVAIPMDILLVFRRSF